MRPLAGRGRAELTREERTECRWYADQALDALRRAIAAGLLATPPPATSDLDSPRARAMFPALVMDAVFPDNPFAVSRSPFVTRSLGIAAWTASGACTPVLRPDLADGTQLPLDGVRDAAELAGDLDVGVPLHLPQRHLMQCRVAEPAEEPMALVGHLSGQLRRRDVPDDLVDVKAFEFRQDAEPTAPSRWPPFVPDQVDRLAHGQDEQHLPQVVAVLEPGNWPLAARRKKLSRTLEDDILLVGNSQVDGLEAGASQANEALEYWYQIAWAACWSPHSSDLRQLVIDPSSEALDIVAASTTTFRDRRT